MEDRTNTPDTISSTPASPGIAENAAPEAAQATQTILGHIESAGKSELVALKPLIAAIVRKFAASWEAAHGGITGKIEAHILNAVIDSAFGPPPAE